VRVLLVLILLVVGAAAIVAGVLYLTQPAHSLPTFFPGYAAHGLGMLKKHGYAGVAAGVVLVVVALAVGMTGSRRRGAFR
jgi:phosphoglycerol transferase MdoB-like AlkP superfamily enzyme